MKTSDYSLLAGNLMLMHELAGLLRDCAEAGIQLILLKGAAMLALGLAAENERMMSDIDVLVKRRDLDEFIRIIGRSGYQQIGWSSRDYSKKSADSLIRIALDIHTELWHARLSESLWADAQPAAVEGVAAFTLSWEGMALHCISHALLHSACLSERALADIRRITQAEGFSWERLAQMSDQLGLGVLVRPVLVELRAPDSVLRGIKVALAHKPWYPFFSRAARRREPARFWEYLLPVLFRPSLAWAAAFPEKETIISRFGVDSSLNRAKRPFQLLWNAFRR